jgi:two-component system nitrate/nitrite response regulator NarL
MKRKIKVMLVEDHAGYREVITLALKSEETIELICQFATAEIALRSLRDMATRAIPDLILLDLNLPGLSGLEALPHFKQTIPDTEIIILTQSDKPADIVKAISLGARGYLLKSATAKQIREAITTVMDGGAPLDPSIARFILNTLKTQLPKVALGCVLSEREMEILTLLAEGLVKKEIADRLCISSNTVITHVRHIYEKLNVPNAPSAVSKAYRIGLFPPES